MMLFGPIRAVVVDDNPIHLLTITNGLSAAGIPCASHWFNRESSNLVPLPPETGYKHLRLVFMDLNLHETVNPDPQTLFYNVADALKKIVSPDSGPYILVFWTDVSSKVTAVKDLFFQVGRLEGIPHPIEIKDLRKGQFLPILNPNAENFSAQMQMLYQEIAEKTTALKEAVAAISAESPLLNTICGWESRASEAASESINSITAHAREDAGENFSEVGTSIATILGEVAYEAVGEEIALSHPARALDAGMVEILVDQFNSSVEQDNYKDNVSAAIIDKISNDRIFRNPQHMAASLNRYFHIDTSETIKATDRGAVLLADALFTRDHLGKNPLDLIESEFTYSVSRILKGLKLQEGEVENKRSELKARLAQLKESSKLVLVEVGADCDHAQSKPRTRRYLIGLEISVDYIDFMRDVNGRLVHEALQCFGPWRTEDAGTRYLLVSCRRYWAWQQSTLPKSARVRYRLRSSIVNKLLHHYTVWSNRPGIVEFRA